MLGTNIHEVWMQNVQDFWRLYYFRDFSFTPLVPKKGSYGQRGSKVLVPTPKDVLKAILVVGGDCHAVSERKRKTKIHANL